MTFDSDEDLILSDDDKELNDDEKEISNSHEETGSPPAKKAKKDYKNLFRRTLDYNNKLILAPMVKIGTLPARLLALEMGADIVYSEELIDHKLMRCIRKKNNLLGTIDFFDEQEDNVVFRTCKLERGKVVLQIGTADADRAVRVAKLVEKDVAAIDVNMGCPKSFSVAGGMGVALAANIDNAKKILTALVGALSIPVTCKIRIRKTTEETIAHVKELASTGISAIGIHARTKDERPQHSPHPEVIKAVVEANIGIPIICNGGSREITKYKDIQVYKDLCGCSSIMIARAAEWNPSIYRPTGTLDKIEVIKMYLRYAVRFGNSLPNTKFNVQNILLDLQETEMGKQFLAADSMEQICKVFGLENYYRKKDAKLKKRHHELLELELKNPLQNKKFTYFGMTSEPIRENVKFFRANYTKDTELPKSIFHLYAKKNFNETPIYDYDRKGSNFRAVILFNKKLYASSLYEKNKRFSEQSACLAACLQHNLIDREECIKNGSLDPIGK